MEDKKKITFIVLNLFIFFISTYLLTYAGGISDVSQLRVEVLESIVRGGDLSVPSGMGIRGSDGREYSWFSIGSVLFAFPFFITGKLAGIPPASLISIMSLLISASTAVIVFLFSISLGYSRRASLSVSIFYGLGTMAWYYSKDSGDHTLETFFVLLSIYFMCLYSINKRVSHLLFSAFSIGLAFLARPTSILAVPPLLILMISQYPEESDFKARLKFLMGRGALFFLSLLPFVGLFFWYNYCRFGSIFETGYGLMAARLGLDFFTGTPLLTGLLGFLVSPGKGFFYYSPIAVLFFFSIKPFSKKHPLPAFCFVLIIMLYLFFYSRNIYWHGDWTWGPRYIFVATPFMVIPIAALIDSFIQKGKNIHKTIVYAIFGVSVVVQISAVSVNTYKYFYRLINEEKVKFTVAYGEGAQPIYEPPPETYFDWHSSPILAQIKFIHEIGGNLLKGYRYAAPPKQVPQVERMEAELQFNVFDFWWLYEYYYEGSYSGFVAAAALFLIAVFSASRLKGF